MGWLNAVRALLANAQGEDAEQEDPDEVPAADPDAELPAPVETGEQVKTDVIPDDAL